MLELKFGKKIIKTERQAFVMGILNVTPDSFFENSRGGLEKAFELIQQGADVLDIGGESTRPGFTEVDAEEQIKRIIPVLNAIRKESDIPVSIDTRNSEVFKACFEAGADVFNDVSALQDDKNSAKVIAECDAGVILMHRYTESENRTSYPDIIQKITEELNKTIDYALSEGISKDKIIVDPGIGFGKTSEENIRIIKEFDDFCKIGYPVLMALSRKRCIGNMLERDNQIQDRLAGTLAADILSIQKGAKMIRVHDVQESIDALNVMKYLQ